jgi:predicted RNA-binding Zn ribbon-like protein
MAGAVWDQTGRAGAGRPPALLAQAIRLRALARRLIARQKEGEDSDVRERNTFLHAYLSAPHPGVDEDGKLTLSRKPGGDAIAAVLGPVAEAVAELLVTGTSLSSGSASIRTASCGSTIAPRHTSGAGAA